jgi:hypothetical protein
VRRARSRAIFRCKGVVEPLFSCKNGFFYAMKDVNIDGKMEDEISKVYKQEEGWMETRFYAFTRAFGDLLRDMYNTAYDEMQFHYKEFCDIGVEEYYAEFGESKKWVDPDWLKILREWKQ